MLTSLVLAIGRKLFSFDQVANDQSMGQTAGLTYQCGKYPLAACFNMMIRINYIIIQPVTWRKYWETRQWWGCHANNYRDGAVAKTETEIY